LYVYPSPSFFGFILIIRLEGAAAQVKVPRMYYQNFDTNITAKYAVVIKNWPLSKFCSPGDVGSLNELEILYNAFQSGATYFQHLTDDEFREWMASRVSQDSQQENNTFGSAGASTGKFFQSSGPFFALFLDPSRVHKHAHAFAIKALATKHGTSATYSSGCRFIKRHACGDNKEAAEGSVR
jgi:hypothetical protein